MLTRVKQYHTLIHMLTRVKQYHTLIHMLTHVNQYLILITAWHASQLPLNFISFKQILSKSAIKSIIISMGLSIFMVKLLRQLNITYVIIENSFLLYLIFSSVEIMAMYSRGSQYFSQAG